MSQLILSPIDCSFVTIVHFCFGVGLILSLRWPRGDLPSVLIPDLIQSLRAKPVRLWFKAWFKACHSASTIEYPINIMQFSILFKAWKLLWPKIRTERNINLHISCITMNIRQMNFDNLEKVNRIRFNRMEPRQEPWGTPHSKLNSSESVIDQYLLRSSR